MTPESGGCGSFIVPIFDEVDAEKILLQFSILWQDVASLVDFEIYPSIACVFNEVVFINELLRDI